MDFIKTFTEPATDHTAAYLYIFSDHKILVRTEPNDAVSIPCIEKESFQELGLTDPCFFGTYKGIPCYCAKAGPIELPGQLGDAFLFMNTRSVFGKIAETLLAVVGYARQINDWNVNFKYCGKCGMKTKRKTTEHARVCEDCNLTSYPRISPAIITAVIKEDKILLARNVNFPDSKMFSVLAGFVEPGETLEECVKREVFEEVGIRVNNIQYFQSESWPFPDSLMIGFTAEHEKGDISIDPGEIAEAGWFNADNLPSVPGRQVIAGRLIKWFVEDKKQTG